MVNFRETLYRRAFNSPGLQAGVSDNDFLKEPGLEPFYLKLNTTIVKFTFMPFAQAKTGAIETSPIPDRN